TLNSLANSTSIGDDFLMCCWDLTKLDLSPLKNIRSIGYDFLTGCYGLKDIILPDKDPASFEVSNKEKKEGGETHKYYYGFMEDVPEDVVIHCGEYLSNYKTTDPWSDWTSQMKK
ncbi:MAG: hypothetical protein HUJ52_01860, partial [Malacoplasma sp.]|nr:hypothetical protein [Malacoplasma sp.]